MHAKRRSRLLLVLGVIALGICLTVWLRRDNEPSHEGKTLSKWLEDICGTSSGEPNFMAVEAIRAIGTNGISHLFKMLSYKPSRLRVTIVGTSNRLLRDRLHWRKEYFVDPVYWRWDQAVCGFIALGSTASNAVPQLIALLDDPYVGGKAVLSLTSIGAPAVPALADVLTNGTLRARRQLASHMSDLGTNARTALPALLVCVKDTNSDVRCGAVQSLALLKLEPSAVVPALTDALIDPDHNIRYWALTGLGRFGPLATNSASTVARLLTDSNPIVRAEATNTLRIVTFPSALPQQPTPRHATYLAFLGDFLADEQTEDNLSER